MHFCDDVLSTTKNLLCCGIEWTTDEMMKNKKLNHLIMSRLKLGKGMQSHLSFKHESGGNKFGII